MRKRWPPKIDSSGLVTDAYAPVPFSQHPVEADCSTFTQTQSSVCRYPSANNDNSWFNLFGLLPLSEVYDSTEASEIQGWEQLPDNASNSLVLPSPDFPWPCRLSTPSTTCGLSFPLSQFWQSHPQTWCHNTSPSFPAVPGTFGYSAIPAPLPTLASMNETEPMNVGFHDGTLTYLLPLEETNFDITSPTWNFMGLYPGS